MIFISFHIMYGKKNINFHKSFLLFYAFCENPFNFKNLYGGKSQKDIMVFMIVVFMIVPTTIGNGTW